jgi:hypothetical protein
MDKSKITKEDPTNFEGFLNHGLNLIKKKEAYSIMIEGDLLDSSIRSVLALLDMA